MGDNDICIGHLPHTEAEVIAEEVSASDVDDALLITVMMQMQPFRIYLLDELSSLWAAYTLIVHIIVLYERVHGKEEHATPINTIPLK